MPIYYKQSPIEKIYYKDNLIRKIYRKGIKVYELPCLSFIEESNTPFILTTHEYGKTWDGILYYSTDMKNWSEWNGKNIHSSDSGELYLRGINNTKITDCSDDCFIFKNEEDEEVEYIKIQCRGNIETLLNYQMVASGEHPPMGEECFANLFQYCKALTRAPELPATTLSDLCYYNMFYQCDSLVEAPELPATTLTKSCYFEMFAGCISLLEAPELPATTLTENCYDNMFNSCRSLVKPPSKLPATTLADGCYSFMFGSCPALTGTIHCPKSTADNPLRLTPHDLDLSEKEVNEQVKIVFDL